MVKKQIQKHDFLTGGPVLQREIYFGNDWVWFSTSSGGPRFSKTTFSKNISTSYNLNLLTLEENNRNISDEEYQEFLRKVEHL